MFLNNEMAGLASYMGTSPEIAAMLVSVIMILVVMAILVYTVEMEGLPLFFAMLLLLGLCTVLVWIPTWIALIIFFVALSYIFFGGELGAK